GRGARSPHPGAPGEVAPDRGRHPGESPRAARARASRPDQVRRVGAERRDHRRAAGGRV
ncbi:MAG: FIG028593: membrane protein, partial [uncultured Thermomicrobiales bacterium]